MDADWRGLETEMAFTYPVNMVLRSNILIAIFFHSV